MNLIIDILNKKIKKSKNDKYIVKKIIKYLGYQCEKCYNYTDKKLRYVISFNNGKSDYRFEDGNNKKYSLKKFCDRCIYYKTSECNINIEIKDYLY